MSALPQLPSKTRKAFVCYLDTYFGAAVTRKLLAKDIEVVGLLKDPSGLMPNKVKKAFRRHEVDHIRRALLDCDIIVYELVDGIDEAISAIRLLSSTHLETPKRFVLVSSVMSWFETPLLQEDPNEDPEPLTEDQYNRRVPHAKYLAWRDVEKLCGSVDSDMFRPNILFSGVQYGNGENVLNSIFKQAWCLGEEGIPIYGSGKQRIPMVHVADCATMATKLLLTEEPPTSRYSFAVDEGTSSWKDIVGAINEHLGNGKAFVVPPSEFCLHDNVEHFTIDLAVEPQSTVALMEEEDWVSKGGFVENIEAVSAQYRKVRCLTPLRTVVLGGPLVGKTFASREIAEAMRIPHFTVADVIAEYKYQEIELAEELQRLHHARLENLMKERQDAHRERIREEQRIAKEEAGELDVLNGQDADDDDVEEEEEFDIELSEEELAEIREQAEDDGADDKATAVKEQIDELRKVLAMRLKPLADAASNDPPNPKDKKKPAPKKKRAEEPIPDGDARLSDRALAIIVRWKLSQKECRNRGYVLDGFPKTVRQARLLFEDAPLEVFEDPDEPDLPLDPEEKQCGDELFPEFVVHCKASDTFLLERLQRVQYEHPHNNPDDFQRRLDVHKQHFEIPNGVIQYLESARSVAGKRINVRSFNMEDSPLVPPPPPTSIYAPKPIDETVRKIIESLGKPRNFGPTPQDARREAERKRLYEQELEEKRQADRQRVREEETKEVVASRKAREEETARVEEMKEAERRMLEERKEPLKAYLMQSVIPILTKGLIDVCNRRPDDPVDYLAEWLFRHNPEDDSMY